MQFLIVNMDKKEFIQNAQHYKRVHEWPVQDSIPIIMLYSFLTDKWIGDRVYVVSEYPKFQNPNGELAKLYKELEREASHGDLSVYQIVKMQFEEVNPMPFIKTKDYMLNNFKFLYNHKTKQYIDFTKNPPIKDDFYLSGGMYEVNSLSPLFFLIMLHDVFPEFVEQEEDGNYLGAWSEHSQYLEVSSKEYNLGYEEFNPGFCNLDKGNKILMDQEKDDMNSNRELFLQDIEAILNYARPKIEELLPHKNSQCMEILYAIRDSFYSLRNSGFFIGIDERMMNIGILLSMNKTLIKHSEEIKDSENPTQKLIDICYDVITATYDFF